MMTDRQTALAVSGRGVATVTLARAAKRNAITTRMLHDLREDVGAIGRDGRVRVVVVRGDGGTFSAGADILEWTGVPAAQAERQSRLGREVFRELAELSVPSVAVIDGAALGGGLELALACDIRIAATDATLGMPETSLGNLPGWGGVARLVGAAGLTTATHMVLSAAIVDGREAERRAIVTTAVASAELDAAVESYVGRLLANDATALSLAKSVLRDFSTSSATEPAIAGLTAILETSRARKEEFLRVKAQRRQSRLADLQAAGAPGEES
jgi:enoyl-CoA hydratase/carnithine racemase